MSTGSSFFPASQVNIIPLSEPDHSTASKRVVLGGSFPCFVQLATFDNDNAYKNLKFITENELRTYSQHSQHLEWYAPSISLVKTRNPSSNPSHNTPHGPFTFSKGKSYVHILQRDFDMVNNLVLLLSNGATLRDISKITIGTCQFTSFDQINDIKILDTIDPQLLNLLSTTYSDTPNKLKYNCKLGNNNHTTETLVIPAFFLRDQIPLRMASVCYHSVFVNVEFKHAAPAPEQIDLLVSGIVLPGLNRSRMGNHPIQNVYDQWVPFTSVVAPANTVHSRLTIDPLPTKGADIKMLYVSVWNETQQSYVTSCVKHINLLRYDNETQTVSSSDPIATNVCDYMTDVAPLLVGLKPSNHFMIPFTDHPGFTTNGKYLACGYWGTKRCGISLDIQLYNPANDHLVVQVGGFVVSGVRYTGGTINIHMGDSN